MADKKDTKEKKRAPQQTKPTPITTKVMNRVMDLEKTQGFTLPKGYNASNALNKALIYLQTTPSSLKNVTGSMLETSDGNSVAQALFDMVIQGLSPNQTQVYFIQRNNYKNNTIELDLQRSYFGTQMVLKRLPEIKDIKAFVVHEGDEFETDFDMETLQDKITKFKHSWENQDNAIDAAVAVIYKTDGTNEITVMTKKQINTAWQAAKTDKIQKQFPEEMAKRTVINRAAKNIINTSAGDAELLSSIHSTLENEYDNSERKEVTGYEEPSGSLDDFINGGTTKKAIEEHSEINGVKTIESEEEESTNEQEEAENQDGVTTEERGFSAEEQSIFDAVNNANGR